VAGDRLILLEASDLTIIYQKFIHVVDTIIIVITILKS
jgi:hypothetical protein